MHGELRAYDSTDDLRAAAAKSVIECDDGAYTDHSTAARSAASSTTGNVLEVAADDKIYIGSATPFARVKVVLDTVSAGGGDLILEYWDGDSWETLTVGTDGTNDGTATLAEDGVIDFKPPSDWAAGNASISALNSAFYYIRVATTTNPGTAPDFEQIFPVDGQYFSFIFDMGDLNAPEGRARPEETFVHHRGRGHSDYSHAVAGPDAPIFDPLDLSFSARVGNTYATLAMLVGALTCGNPDYATTWDATGTSTKGTSKVINGAGTAVTTPAFEDSSKKTVDIQILWTRNSVRLGMAYHEVFFSEDQLQLQESEESVLMSVTGKIYGKIEPIYYFAQQFYAAL